MTQNLPLRHLVCALLLAAGVLNGSPLSAADADTTTNGGNSVQPLSPPSTTELSAADQATMQDITDKINSDLELTFPTGALPDNMSFDDIQARMNAARMTTLNRGEGRAKAQLGTREVTLSDTPFFGSARITTSLVERVPSLRADRILGPTEHFAIIDGSQNMLEDVNRRLQRASNRVSKFACGNFDWVAQLRYKFRREALNNYVQALEANALPAAAMALIATWSPTLYEIIKWLRALATTELSADAAKCEQLEAALTSAGQRMVRGAGYAQCMESYSNTDIAEAHRNCDPGGTGAWDGVENWAGQIRSFGVDSGTVDVVSEMSSFVAPSTYPQAEADAVELRTRDVEREAANVAAHPDPGAEPAAGAGHADWVRAKEAHNVAQSRYDEASRNLTAAQEVLDANTSTWDSLRYSISKNMSKLFGSVKVNARGDLEFGHQPKIMIRLKLDHTAYKAGLLLQDALKAHFDLLRQRSSTDTGLQTTFNESYRTLHIMCLESMTHAWRNELNRREPFDDMTLDKMAYMYALFLGTPQGNARNAYENVNRIGEHLSNVVHYEVYAYAYNEWEENRFKFLEAARKYTSGSGNQMSHLYDAFVQRADLNSKILLEGKEEWQQRLAETLPIINSFKLPISGTGVIGNGSNNYGTPVAIPPMYNP